MDVNNQRLNGATEGGVSIPGGEGTDKLDKSVEKNNDIFNRNEKKSTASNMDYGIYRKKSREEDRVVDETCEDQG